MYNKLRAKCTRKLLWSWDTLKIRCPGLGFKVHVITCNQLHMMWTYMYQGLRWVIATIEGRVRQIRFDSFVFQMQRDSRTHDSVVNTSFDGKGRRYPVPKHDLQLCVILRLSLPLSHLPLPQNCESQIIRNLQISRRGIAWT